MLPRPPQQTQATLEAAAHAHTTTCKRVEHRVHQRANTRDAGLLEAASPDWLAAAHSMTWQTIQSRSVFEALSAS